MDSLKRAAIVLIWAWCLTIVALGAAVFLSAIASQPTEIDPTGGAGFHASMMALCVSSLFLTYNTIKIKGSHPSDYIVNLVVGIGLFVSAYFWVSSELGVHPLAPEFSNTMLVLSILMAFIALLLIPFVALIFSFTRASGTKRKSSE